MAETAKKTRKVLTPQERIAKLEAELESARTKAKSKQDAHADRLVAKYERLRDQVNERQKKMLEIEEDLRELGYDDVVAEITAVVDEDEMRAEAESS